AGAGLILIAVAASSFTASTSHQNWSRGIVAALGVIVTVAGLVAGRKKQFFIGVSVLLFNTLIVFLVVEFIGITGLFVIKQFTSEESIDPKEVELRLNSGVYRPYVLWRASPYNNSGVCIQDNGLRAVPEASDDPSAIQVFVFGGSTVVGWRIPDRATICAHIQNGLDSITDKPVCVTNFGQQGYVNTQQLIELQLQLRSGNVPDMVVFYDGTNEVWSAFETDTAGMHFCLQEIADLYENRNFSRETDLANYGISDFAKELSSVTLFRTIAGTQPSASRISIFDPKPSKCMLYGNDFVTPAQFAVEIMDIYEADLRILKALSLEFNFEYSVFWQPVLFTGNKPLTPEETAIYESQNVFLRQLYKECECIAIQLDNTNDHFHCITNVFNEVDETVYQDYCHLNALGDSLIAVRILSSIQLGDQWVGSSR
ncbi:MAG: hypothetical protein B1H09_04635, partial [Gemmatimonadaceae bacterium 4484_173]